MTDQSDQNTSDNLATGEAGADQEAWEGADIDTEQLISSDQTSSGSPSTDSVSTSGASTSGASTSSSSTSSPSDTIDESASDSGATEPSDEEATEEAVAVPEPSTELDEPLTEETSSDEMATGETQTDAAPSGDDADGSADHQPASGPAAEATDDARGIYDTAPD